MKLIIDAIQAVTVEFMGVLLVLSSLFCCASWGLHSAAGEERGWSRFVTTVESWSVHSPSVLPAAPPPAERAAFVAGRLDHFSHLLGHVSREVVSSW